MRLVFAGTPQVAADTLERLLATGGHEVIAVVSRPNAPRGRSRRPVPSPVSQLAMDRGIELLRPDHPRDADFITRLQELEPEVCPVVAYGALVPAAALAIPAMGWLNVHYSLLPRWRGAAPVQRALLAGDQISGVTVFRLVEALDAGPVLGQVRTPVAPEETAADLLGRLALIGADLLVEALDALQRGTATLTEQPGVGITEAPKLRPADARLAWTRSALELSRLVAACNPSPMAWAELDQERFRVLRARAAEGEPLRPGEVRIEKGRVSAGTGDGLLELVTVQPQGKRPMAGLDWARGRRGETVLR